MYYIHGKNAKERKGSAIKLNGTTIHWIIKDFLILWIRRECMAWRSMQTIFTVHWTLHFPEMKTEEMYYPLSMVWRECISQKRNKLSLILREVFVLMLQQTSMEKPHWNYLGAFKKHQLKAPLQINYICLWV